MHPVLSKVGFGDHPSHWLTVKPALAQHFRLENRKYSPFVTVAWRMLLFQPRTLWQLHNRKRLCTDWSHVHLLTSLKTVAGSGSVHGADGQGQKKKKKKLLCAVQCGEKYVQIKTCTIKSIFKKKKRPQTATSWDFRRFEFKRTRLSWSCAGHYRIHLHANLHTQTFDFMSPGKWREKEEREKKKSLLMISGVVLLGAVSSRSWLKGTSWTMLDVLETRY